MSLIIFIQAALSIYIYMLNYRFIPLLPELFLFHRFLGHCLR